MNFELKLELKGHPDKTFVNYLLDGFQNGFDTGLSQLPEHSFECKNLLSAQRNPVSTAELTDTELNRGYLIGPFDSIPYKKYLISPVGLAVGKYSGKKRLIVDLSAPHENESHPSLNELINKEDFSLTYVTIDSAIRIIKTLGKGAWMCKVDIKLIPLKESLWNYHGIKWLNKYKASQCLQVARSVETDLVVDWSVLYSQSYHSRIRKIRRWVKGSVVTLH